MKAEELDELNDDTEPVDAESVDAESVDAESVDTESVESESVESEDAASPKTDSIEDTPVSAEESTSTRWWGRAVALGVAAAVFVVLGVAFEIRAHSLRSQAPVKNEALANTAATSEVISQVSAALDKVLSYNYQSPAATEQAASQLLTGDAAGQYKTLFTALQQKAPGEKLTLQAKVVVAGVTQMHGNTAQLLVFLDQSSTRASDKQNSTSAAQLDVTAVKQDGSWKISELLPL